MFLKLKNGLLTKRNNARTMIKYSLSFALFFFYLTRQTLGRDSLKHEAVTLARYEFTSGLVGES